MLASSLILRGELDEAERWLMEGEYALRSEVEPATGMLFHLVRGFLEIARGRAEVALAALRAVEAGVVFSQDGTRRGIELFWTHLFPRSLHEHFQILVHNHVTVQLPERAPFGLALGSLVWNHCV